MASNIIASQEPKGVTVNYSMPLVREKRTYQANDGMRTAKVEQATTVNYRKYFIGVIIAFCLSLISDALAAYLYIHLDHDKHPNVGPIFLVWLVVSCGITYTLALLAFFVYHNLPKNPKTADLEQSRPLQDLRRAGSKKGSVHRQSDSCGSPFPFAHLEFRGRMTGQDYQAKRKSNGETAIYTNFANTPIETDVISPKTPFDDGHPNPLASSPVFGPPPTFPITAVLRTQASNHSGFTNATVTTISTIGNRDPFNKPDADEINTASSISLTSTHAHKVSVTTVATVARSDSLKKIKEAIMRRQVVCYDYY